MMSDVNRPPYRDGRVHVLAERCATCVFRPGNLMHLQAGRLAELARVNIEADSALTCHSTLYRDDVDQAVCRGYYDAYRDRSTPLRLADAMGLIELDPDPPKRSTSRP